MKFSGIKVDIVWSPEKVQEIGTFKIARQNARLRHKTRFLNDGSINLIIIIFFSLERNEYLLLNYFIAVGENIIKDCNLRINREIQSRKQKIETKRKTKRWHDERGGKRKRWEGREIEDEGNR